MIEEFPLRLGPSATFAAVREFLQQAGYTDEALLRHFELPGTHLLLTPFGMHGQYLHHKYQAPERVVFLARILIGGYSASREELSRHFPEPVIDALCELGILEPAPPDGSQLRATVLLHPAMGLFLAGDRGYWPDSVAYRGGDFVMSGAENLSRRYVEHIGRSPCGSFLDLGTGAGFAAVLASRFAKTVVGTDVTDRSIRYAEFNSRLNGADNAEMRKGDLFAPVAGMRFDRIASHPPFEPALKESFVFSIGGEDGEAFIARIVKEAPDHLEPGGRLYLQVTGTDRVGEPFEERVRKWLGPAIEECDVALFVRISCKPMEYATEQVIAENEDLVKLQEWSVLYEKLRAQLVMIGHLVIQRRASARPVFFTRRSFGPASGLAEMDWLLDWETRCTEPEWLMDAKPGPGKGWELFARHVMKDGKLVPLSHTFFNKYPFETNLHCPAWMTVLVGRCDGAASCAAHLEWLRARMPIEKEQLLRAVAALIGMDVLRVEGFAPPAC